MIISAAPLILDQFDSNCVNAVIMQLEIEHNSGEESAEQIKKSLSKGEWFEPVFCFNVSRPFQHLASAKYIILDDKAVQTFYPIVPTPPPSI
ncbi:MAG: hypothetical protein WBP45_10850 [Daejeonella sp.]